MVIQKKASFSNYKMFILGDMSRYHTASKLESTEQYGE